MSSSSSSSSLPIINRSEEDFKRDVEQKEKDDEKKTREDLCEHFNQFFSRHTDTDGSMSCFVSELCNFCFNMTEHQTYSRFGFCLKLSKHPSVIRLKNCVIDKLIDFKGFVKPDKIQILQRLQQVIDFFTVDSH